MAPGSKRSGGIFFLLALIIVVILAAIVVGGAIYPSQPSVLYPRVDFKTPSRG